MYSSGQSDKRKTKGICDRGEKGIQLDYNINSTVWLTIMILTLLCLTYNNWCQCPCPDRINSDW